MAIHSWFDNHLGQITYSMTGSRNGADGTADCSGSITQAIQDAGGKPYDYLYSTVTLGSYLQANDFERITVNGAWDSEDDDIILMSWGADMSSSGGAGGHVGVMHTDEKGGAIFESTDYWTNGQANTAISRHNIDEYLATQKPSYYEVWRKPKSENTDKPINNANNTNNNQSIGDLDNMNIPFLFTADGETGTFFYDGIGTILAFTAPQQQDFFKGESEFLRGKELQTRKYSKAQFDIFKKAYPVKYLQK